MNDEPSGAPVRLQPVTIGLSGQDLKRLRELAAGMPRDEWSGRAVTYGELIRVAVRSYLDANRPKAPKKKARKAVKR